MFSGGVFREIVEGSGDIVVVTDSRLRIAYVSSSVAQLNVPPHDLIRSEISSLLPSDKVLQWQNLLEQGSSSIRDEIKMALAGGESFTFDVHLSRLTDGEWIAIRMRDVSGVREKERRLLQSNQQLDQVIFKTTHDLRSPVRSALGLLNLARMAPLEEKGLYIELIGKTLVKLDGLIDGMNDFFRNQKLALQRSLIRLREEIYEELDLLRPASISGEKISVTVEVDERSEFYSDPIRVRTIITNLLSNALKYSDSKKSEPFINIYVLIDEDFCHLRITDNGIGIDPKYFDKIFEIFFRATDYSEGTGLGLFIVKDTITKLQGEIEVTSKLGEGTTFSIRIPNQIKQPALVA